MSPALERILRRIRPQDAIPPAPLPEIINEEIHPLHFYPGFNEFVAGWNRHATTFIRRELQLDIQSAQFEVDKFPNQSGFLQSEVERLRVEQQRQRKIFDAEEDVPKKEKFTPLKSANRRLRRTREELDRISHQEQRIRQATKTRLETATAPLIDLDNKFAFSLDGDGVDFYVVERLKNDPSAVDAFLLRCCARKGLSGYRQESALWGMNYRFFALLKYYTKKEVRHEELKASADEATRRQLRFRLDRKTSPPTP